jgi:hypothetical protein
LLINEASVRRLCFLLSSPSDQNGFVGELKNFVGTVIREASSRTRERGQLRQDERHLMPDTWPAIRRRRRGRRESPGLDRLP